MYTPEKGYGWVIPDAENVLFDEPVPALDDTAIAARGFPPDAATHEGLAPEFLRSCYWMQVHDKQGCSIRPRWGATSSSSSRSGWT